MPYSCHPNTPAAQRSDAAQRGDAAQQSDVSAPVAASLGQFLLSGGACFVLGTALLWVFTDICKVHYLLSTLLGSLLTSGVGFWLNRRFAFRARAKHFWRELGRYYLVNIGFLALNLSLMGVCVSGFHVPYLAASMGLSVVLSLSNFLIHRFWSFGAR